MKTPPAARRPDLLLQRVDENHLLLIEFKRPSVKLKRTHKNQAEDYRDTLEQYFPDSRIDIIVMGGPTNAEVSKRYKNAGMKYRSYHEIISLARHKLSQWLDTASTESSQENEPEKAK